MLLCNLYHIRARIDCGNGRGVGESGGTLSENATTAANVEVAEAFLSRRMGFESMAAGDEVVTEWIHQVKETRRAVRIPPG